MTRDPAATRHFSADRSSGTSCEVCTKSRRDGTRISAGRERGAKKGADAADGRVAENATAASYAPGPGVEPRGDETYSLFRLRARSASRRERKTPFFLLRMTRCALLFVLAASGRNTTQGARRRTHASEGIAGYAETPLRGSRKSRLPSLPSLIRAEDDAFRAFVAVEVFGGDQANGPATRGRVGSRSPSPGAPDFVFSAAGPPARFFGVLSRRRSALATRWPRPSHHAAESPEAPDEALAKESSFPGARRLANVSEGEARETAGLGFTHLVTPRAPLGRGRVRSMATPMASRPTSPGSFSEAVRARVFVFFFFFAATAKETPPNGAVHQASVSDSSEDDSSFAANGARPREETASPGFFRGAFVSVSVVFFSVFSFSGGAQPSKKTAFARESEGRVFETF